MSIVNLSGRPIHRLPTPIPSPRPIDPPPKRKRNGEVDTLNGLKSVAGILPGITERLEAEARDTRIPVSDSILAQLLNRVTPGVTLRGLVERALFVFLAAERAGADACQCHAKPPARLDDAQLVRLMFELCPTCSACRKIMTLSGSPEDQPTATETPDGWKLVCGDCNSWICWSTEGGAA